jgi:hypothetical protein
MGQFFGGTGSSANQAIGPLFAQRLTGFMPVISEGGLTMAALICGQEPEAGLVPNYDRHDQEIIRRATAQLSRHNHFRCHLESIAVDCRDGSLLLEGRLPSYYLKQVLQTALRDVPGVRRVYNFVDVVSATGLSSV